MGVTRSAPLGSASHIISPPPRPAPPPRSQHAAKICNQLDSTLRMPAFYLFAGLFFLTRVVLVPQEILVPAAVHSRRWISYAVEDFHAAYVVLNVLLGVLYALQLVWMWAIVRVIRQAATSGAEAASQLSAQVDPSKRYAAAAAAATPPKEE